MNLNIYFLRIKYEWIKQNYNTAMSFAGIAQVYEVTKKTTPVRILSQLTLFALI